MIPNILGLRRAEFAGTTATNIRISSMRAEEIRPGERYVVDVSGRKTIVLVVRAATFPDCWRCAPTDAAQLIVSAADFLIAIDQDPPIGLPEAKRKAK